MLEGQRGLAGFDVPELNGVIAGGGGEDVFGGGVEENLSDFPTAGISLSLIYNLEK